MSEALAMLRPATALVREAVAELEPGDWRMPTPCAAWDVQAVVGHLVRGQLGYAALLSGADGRKVVTDLAARSDHLYPDALAAFDRAAGGLTDAFAEPGALDREVAHPMEVIPARRLLLMALVELTVHGWDLAVATGQPAPVDAEVIELLVTSMSMWLPSVQTPYFVAPIPGAPTDSLSLLLARTGRDPSAHAPIASVRPGAGARWHRG